MDGYPVLQIVRCRLGTEMEMDNHGYPFPMATHSHLPHPAANYGHFPRPHYPHPCGTLLVATPVALSFLPRALLCALVAASLLIDTLVVCKVNVKGCGAWLSRGACSSLERIFPRTFEHRKTKRNAIICMVILCRLTQKDGQLFSSI